MNFSSKQVKLKKSVRVINERDIFSSVNLPLLELVNRHMDHEIDILCIWTKKKVNAIFSSSTVSEITIDKRQFGGNNK